MLKTKEEMINEIVALYKDDADQFKRDLERQDFVSVWETYVKHGFNPENSMGDQSDAPKSVEPLNFKKVITAFLLGFGAVSCAIACYRLFSAMGEWLAVNFK